MESKKHLKRILPPLIFVTFILISLGGAVRAMHAGLSCPDWPLCFGDIIPDYQIQVYYEFIHRVIAGLVGLVTLTVAVLVFKGTDVQRETRLATIMSLVLLAVQVVFGGLTVIKMLHFFIVTSHLGLGVAFFSSLIWIYYSLEEKRALAQKAPPSKFRGFLCVLAIAVFTQIILGGLVSTNYAGVACPDWPLCMGELVPTLKGMIGIQVIHRLGAYAVAILIFSFYLFVSRNRHSDWCDPRYYNLSGWLVILILLQIGVGVANVLFRIPPIVTVAHLAVAALIMGLILRLLFISRPVSPSA